MIIVIESSLILLFFEIYPFCLVVVFVVDNHHQLSCYNNRHTIFRYSNYQLNGTKQREIRLTKEILDHFANSDHYIYDHSTLHALIKKKEKKQGRF